MDKRIWRQANDVIEKADELEWALRSLSSALVVVHPATPEQEAAQAKLRAAADTVRDQIRRGILAEIVNGQVAS